MLERHKIILRIVSISKGGGRITCWLLHATVLFKKKQKKQHHTTLHLWQLMWNLKSKGPNTLHFLNITRSMLCRCWLHFIASRDKNVSTELLEPIDVSSCIGWD